MAVQSGEAGEGPGPQTRLEDLERALAEGVVLAVTDAQGRILKANPFMCALSGYAREELLNQDHRILNSGHHSKAFFQELWATIQSGRIWRGEIRNRAKDGRFYWVDTVIVPRMGPDGKPQRYTSIRMDITGRKEAEAELQASEARLAMALDAAQAGFWDWDLVTDQVQRSPRMNEIMGLAGKEADAKALSWVSRVHPEDIPRLERDLEAHIAGEVPYYRANFRLRHEDGHWVHLESRGQVVARDKTGAPLRMAGLMVDRSEQKRQEDAYRETQKLESLGLMAAGIAHDFNNLLQAILGHAEVAEALIRSGGDPMPHCARLRETVGRSRDLLRQLLDYSGQEKVQREPLDLSALVRDMGGLLAVALPKKVRLDVCEGGTPLGVQGSQSQLEQVVLNLVTNAGEALGSEAGIITLRTEKAALGGAELNQAFPGLDLKSGPHALLEVEDSGCGMDELTLARIFQPFFTTKRTGRGLGLAALQGIVNAHGGGLCVQSRPGEGSCFRVFLPLVGQESIP